MNTRLWHSRLEAEGVVSQRQVVVDSLRHTHNLEPLLAQAEADALAAVAADVDHRVDTHVLQLAQHLVATVHGGPRAVLLLHRPRKGAALVGGAKYRTTLYLKALDSLLVEHHYLRRLTQHAVERLHAAHDLPVAGLRGALHHAADHGVQPGAVAAAGEHHHSFQCHRTIYFLVINLFCKPLNRHRNGTATYKDSFFFPSCGIFLPYRPATTVQQPYFQHHDSLPAPQPLHRLPTAPLRSPYGRSSVVLQ